MEFVTRVPAALFTRLLFAASLVMNGKIPTLPSKVTFPSASNIERVMAAKNITFPIKFLLLQVRCGPSSS
ncbi:hypothetical protein A2U01_0085799, partial [Trifolium medium]|nr:hypothetical protein [Trifolium medium]